MPVPQFFMFIRPFLACLQDGESHNIKEIRKQMRSVFNLTDADVAELLPSGRITTFTNRVSWAGTYLSKAGLVDKPARATFCITDAGRDVLQNGPEIIKPDYLLRFDSFRAFSLADESEPMQTKQTTQEEPNETPDDAFESAFQPFQRFSQGQAEKQRK